MVPQMEQSLDGLSFSFWIVSVSIPMGILIPPSKKDHSIHNVVFLLLELVVCELYLGCSELLG